MSHLHTAAAALVSLWVWLSAAALLAQPAATGAAGQLQFSPGKGMSIQSADHTFGLQLRVRTQLLYTAQGVETQSNFVDHLQQGLQVRRARLTLAGHFFGADNAFRLELGFSPADLGMHDGSAPQSSPLLDAYVQFNQLRNASLRVGQYRLPFNRQRMVSSGDLRMVDRSIVDSEFTLNRDVGLGLQSEDFLHVHALRYYAGLYSGDGRDANTLRDFGLLYLARVEYLPLGLFDDHSEADLAFCQTPKLSLGLAYSYIDRAQRTQGTHGNVPSDGGTTNLHNLTADFVFRFLGLSVDGELAYRHGKRHAGDVKSDNGTAFDDSDDVLVVEEPRNGLGFMLQAGMLLRGTPWEIVARAAVNRSIGESSLTDRNEYGLGINYYFAGHPFKLQGDVFRLATKAPGATGYAWDDRVRVQLQASM